MMILVAVHSTSLLGGTQNSGSAIGSTSEGHRCEHREVWVKGGRVLTPMDGSAMTDRASNLPLYQYSKRIKPKNIESPSS